MSARPRPAIGVQAGIDEAGLGPLLGPLTLGVCALRVPAADCDPWRALSACVSDDPAQDQGRIVVADSKLVFARTPRGAQRLERSALAFLLQRAAGPGLPLDAQDLLRSFGPELCPLEDVQREFWGRHLGFMLPQHGPAAELAELAGQLRDELAAARIELCLAAVRVLPVLQLNQSFDATGNKARTHWLATRPLIEHLWREHAAEGLRLVVDRQGGRVHYEALLRETFPGARLELVEERAPLSAYVLDEGTRHMQISFRERAESCSFAVALASCLAKYVRETAMRAFNDYWRTLDPELAPTAGYVTDARRWLTQARSAIERSTIPRRELVRER